MSVLFGQILDPPAGLVPELGHATHHVARLGAGASCALANVEAPYDRVVYLVGGET